MQRSFQTAEALVAALRAGAVTSVELTDEAIARIERDDKVINAICVPDFDRARAAAHRADQARARGADRPLLGIPVTVKESYNIAGLPTTWGMPPHRDYVPTEDAVQGSRLKAAGAVVLGKTNVPLGLQDIQSFNEIYGTTNNPWDHGRTSGGSSGGPAAALAAGFGTLEANPTSATNKTAIKVGGSYKQSANGTLQLAIGGTVSNDATNEYDRLNIAGTANLDGTLHVVGASGYVPHHQDEQVILTAE